MQKILNLIIISLVVILLSLLGYYLYNSQNKSVEHIKQKVVENQSKSLFPSIDTEFNFKTIDGISYKIKTSEKQIIVEGAENKIIFLKIFGWDCKYCIKEIPELINLKKDLADSFEVIAIEAQQHSKDKSIEYIKKYGINYSIVDGEDQRKFYEYLKTYYGWSGVIPLTIVLGKGGNILAYEVGAKSYTLSELMKASLLRDKEKS